MKLTAKRRNYGITLTELLVSMAIGSVVIFFLGDFFVKIGKSMSESSRRANFRSDVGLLFKEVQRSLFTDMVINGFSGKTTDRTHMRMLLPTWGECVDGTACNNAMGLVYVTKKPTHDTALWGICLVNVANNFATLIFDGNNANSIITAFNSATGEMKINGKDNIFAAGGAVNLSTSFKGTLWRLENRPQIFTVTYSTPNSRWEYGAGLQLPDTCLQNISRDGGGNPRTDQLYSMTIRPVVLKKWTGGTAVSASTINSTMIDFPLRATGVSVGMLGARSSPPLYNWGSVNCSLPSFDTIDCNQPFNHFAAGISTIRLAQHFNVVLFNGTTVNEAKWYDLKPTAWPELPGCSAPECSALTMPAMGSFLVLRTAAESYDNLDAAGFSLIKQDQLKMLKFILQQSDTHYEEALFHVN